MTGTSADVDYGSTTYGKVYLNARTYRMDADVEAYDDPVWDSDYVLVEIEKHIGGTVYEHVESAYGTKNAAYISLTDTYSGDYRAYGEIVRNDKTARGYTDAVRATS